MPQFLLDTDHLTLFERRHVEVCQRFDAQPAGAVAVSAVSVEEALRGRLARLSQKLVGAPRVDAYLCLLETVRLVARMPLVLFDQASESRFQQIRGQHPRIGAQDLKIAAVALAYGLTILTRNRRDFAVIQGLRIEDWST